MPRSVNQPDSYKWLMAGCRPNGFGTAFGLVHLDTFTNALGPLYEKLADYKRNRLHAFATGDSDAAYGWEERIDHLDEVIAIVEKAVRLSRDEAREHGHDGSPRNSSDA